MYEMHSVKDALIVVLESHGIAPIPPNLMQQNMIEWGLHDPEYFLRQPYSLFKRWSKNLKLTAAQKKQTRMVVEAVLKVLMCRDRSLLNASAILLQIEIGLYLVSNLESKLKAASEALSKPSTKRGRPKGSRNKTKEEKMEIHLKKEVLFI